MTEKRLLTHLGLAGIFMLLVVMLLGGACTGPAGPAGPPGPAGSPGPRGPVDTPATQSQASFVIVPAIQVVSEKNSITFLGAGFNTKDEIHIKIFSEQRFTADGKPLTPLETDVTFSCQPVPKVNDGGAFDATLNLQERQPGSYTVAVVGRGGDILATAPLKLVKQK